MAKAGIVNEVDMLQALNKGRVGGAAFDVYVEVGTPLMIVMIVSQSYDTACSSHC